MISRLCGAALLILLLISAPALAQSPAALESAAAIEQSDAMLRLGDYYSDGVAVPPDYPRALEFYQQAADAGRDSGRLRIAEMTLNGQGVTQDIEGGIAILEELAADDYPRALVVLGGIYLPDTDAPVAPDPARALDYLRRAAATDDTTGLIAYADALAAGYVRPVDVETIAASYERAAALGRPEGYLRLGDLWSDGRVAPVDLAQGYRYFTLAADAGSETGRLATATMMARGQGVPQDVAGGLAVLQELAGAGSASAQLALGRLLISGDAGAVDVEGAVAAFEAAGEAGRSEAYVLLGQMFIDGLVTPTNRARAQGYFNAAIAAGNDYARYVLGRGYAEGRFGALGSVAEGVALLEAAAAAGVPEAPLGLSSLFMYGYGVPQDPQAALTILDFAASEGNLAAIEQLISIFREGRTDGDAILVPRAPDLARTYLDAIADRIDSGEYLAESLLIDAANARADQFAALMPLMRQLPPGDQESVMRNLVDIAPNAYVYIVQAQLTEIGLYTGPLSGLLDTPTIQAVNRFCAMKSVVDQCRYGPLTSPTAQILAYAF